jgi:cobalt-zinc-cadmium resistance protein CzcA
VIVRGSGRLQSLDEIRGVPIKLDVQGKPIPLSAVADVREAYAQRMGGATYDGEETVLGTVLMLSGANSRQVSIDAERALKEAPLPPDVRLESLYTRSYLVNATLKTVVKNLAEGAVLVVAVLFLILGNLRAALFVSLAIPISMLFGVIGMRVFGVSASLMSLGAIDFGLLVDGAVVMIENILRAWRNTKANLRHGSVSLVPGRREGSGQTGFRRSFNHYAGLRAHPVLEGIEGKLYHPMAVTVLMALGASLLVAVLLMPVLAYLFLEKPKKGGKDRIYRGLLALYRPTLNACLKRPALALVPAAVLLVASVLVYQRLGSDFMPPLDEGDMVVNFTRESDIGVDASLQMQRRSDRVIARFPEVERVFSGSGHPNPPRTPWAFICRTPSSY